MAEPHPKRKLCRNCHEPIPAGSGRRVYCSPDCADAATRPPATWCRFCWGSFVPDRWHHLYCSERCAKASARFAARLRRPTRRVARAP